MTTATAHNNQCTYLGAEYDARTSRISPAPYCGCPTNGFSSYCEDHYPVVYKVGSGLRKRHADIRRANAVWDLESEFNAIVMELGAE